MNIRHGHDHLSYGHEVWVLTLAHETWTWGWTAHDLDMNMKDMNWSYEHVDFMKACHFDMSTWHVTSWQSDMSRADNMSSHDNTC